MRKLHISVLLVALFIMLSFNKVQAQDSSDAISGWGVSLDYKFQSWEPDDIFGAEVLTTGLNLLGIEFGVGTTQYGFNPLISYEFAPAGDPAAQDDLLEISEDEASGWERLFADLSWTFASGKTVSFIFDRQIYLTSVQTDRDYWYFDGSDVTLLIPGDIVRNTTVMEDLQVLYGFPAFQYGLYNLSYEKPFSTDIQNGQIGIYRTELSSTGLLLKSKFSLGILDFSASYKFGLVSDLIIGASSSAAALLGEFDDSLDFSELTASVQAAVYQRGFKVVVGTGYTVRDMSADIQLTKDELSSVYVNLSKSF
ncbi:MAG: hypothetical protein ACI845_002528 [Gammaproteobacteria bacterium]|jgi:hypothetical protein